MSDLTVNIQTPSGFEVQGALIPDNITVQQVIAELLRGLSLPRLANGQLINYSLVLVNRGLVLQGDQTLQDGGVQYGDTIRLVTGVERTNGSQASRAVDRNGGSSGVGDPAWQAAAPGAGGQTGQAVPPPVVAPPVAAPVVNNDWARDAAPVVNNYWRSEVAAVVDDDWPHDRGAVLNNAWPRDAAAVVTDNWPAEAQTSPAFEPAEESSRSFAMADAARAGGEESKESTLALSHIEIDGGWTASELSEWLAKLELAYSRLNAFLCLSDEDITRAGSVPDSKAGSGSLDDAFALLV